MPTIENSGPTDAKDDLVAVEPWARARMNADAIRIATLQAQVEALAGALGVIERRAKPHSDDTDADRKRSLYHITSHVRAALALKTEQPK